MDDNRVIGIAKRDIEEGEIIATVDLETGKVSSDNVELLDGGREVIQEMTAVWRFIYGY